ncbi:uncharacterized mitochondrial protein-like protein [Tanacetum coccineum]
MSSMGELTFFLGLQVKQMEDGILISQDKYVTEILKKFGFTDVKTASTPMETQKLLLKDEDGEEVDVHLYRSMIGSLMYLTSSRPDIMFVVCACVGYQVNPKVSHLYAMKRIFRYLKGQPKLGLWYPEDSSFDLVAYTDSDFAGASLDRKSTTGGCQFLRSRLISWQCKKQTVVVNSTTEAEYVAASSCCGQALFALQSTRMTLELANCSLCVPKGIVEGYHTKGQKTKSKRQTKHGMEKAVKDKAKSKQKVNQVKKVKRGRPSGPTTNIADEAVNEENVSKHSNDPLLSGEDSLKLEELMALKIDDIDVDERVTLVDETQGRINDEEMFDTGVLDDEECLQNRMWLKEVSTADHRYYCW